MQAMLGADKYRNLVRVSRATAFRDLEESVRHGLLVRAGIGRGTRYFAAVEGREAGTQARLVRRWVRRVAARHVVLQRIWELRHDVTACDAAYLALAEGLAAPLVTRDATLAAAVGHRARVEFA